MSLMKSVGYDGALLRQVQSGDVVAASEVIPATISSTTPTVTGQMLFSGIVLKSNGSAGTDTIDSAANIVAAVVAGIGGTGIQPGTTTRLKYIQSTAFASTLTATANTGITVTNGVVNASSVKEFLVTVVNGTPAKGLFAQTTNSSAVLSGISQSDLQALTPGMVVTNAVAGLQGTTILSINIAAGTVTMSGNANATNTTPVSVSFSPVISIYGIGQGLL